MTYEPKNLDRWTLPDSYAGGHWPDYFVFLGQHRDSNALDRSNFECGLRELGGESDTVRTVCESHWGVGWVEWIAIHESDAAALEIADETVAALADYPVVDESHYSELEWTETQDYWQSISVKERIYWCDRAGVSIFAARRDYIDNSTDPNGTLYDLLRD